MKDSNNGPGYFKVRYLRHGFGARLCSLVLYAEDGKVAQAIVEGSGVAVPGTVRLGEPAETIDVLLARGTDGHVYPPGALVR